MYTRDRSTTFFDGLHLTARTRTKLEFGFVLALLIQTIKKRQLCANVVRKKERQDRLKIYHQLKIFQSRP
jgi:hypothetical protein